mmetsp:Transcript_7165/g.11316  ORF Transcript_7165/g.11316 Transcript_7165/m.11316 type:complete len:137 (+) Transcript_7165:64-474(+)
MACLSLRRVAMVAQQVTQNQFGMSCIHFVQRQGFASKQPYNPIRPKPKSGKRYRANMEHPFWKVSTKSELYKSLQEFKVEVFKKHGLTAEGYRLVDADGRRVRADEVTIPIPLPKDVTPEQQQEGSERTTDATPKS